MTEVNKVYDLEQAMLDCWSVVDDLKLLYANVLDNQDMTLDEISNVLLGLSSLYEMKHQKAADVFSGFVDEVFKELRKGQQDQP